MTCLVAYARQQKWPRGLVQSLKSFLTDMVSEQPTRRNDDGCSLERYSRQMRFYGIGEAGQRKLMAAHVTLCGCGALGTVLANILVRAGVGHVRLIDRDFIETSNLQRQVLFDEHDVAENLPKAEAAARKLGAINSSVHVEPVVTDIDRTNILELCAGRRPDPRRHG